MTAENMFGKLSFLKRASRSLAKTGLFLGFFGTLFLSLFLVRFLKVPGRSFGSQWFHFELISELFFLLLDDFSEIRGISENCTHSRVEINFWRFWDFQFRCFFVTF